jgi:hypothetical protein
MLKRAWDENNVEVAQQFMIKLLLAVGEEKHFFVRFSSFLLAAAFLSCRSVK